jgi:acyl-CoA synthetase (AMP-forming)/AMP-acid ligase II
MSVKLTILEQMEQVAREHGKILAPLKEDLVLADCGLDSLGFAVLVARLERMSLVRPRQNPITGAIVVAEVVLKAEGKARQVELKDDILKLCHAALPRHKVPAAISFVPALNVASTGKLLRR